MMADLLRLPTFAPNGRVHVVVESPRHAQTKYKFSPFLQCFEFSRELTLGLSYPYDWGFVPSSCAANGDPLDGLIIHEATTFPGMVVPCRPIGVLEVQQREKAKTFRNDRVLFVPDDGLKEQSYTDITDLPPFMQRALETFFVEVIRDTEKELEFLGWRGARHALDAVHRYAEEFNTHGGTGTMSRGWSS